MGHGVHVQELPGIGRRYDLHLEGSPQRVSVVWHKNAARDLYVFTGRDDEPSAVIELTEEQARKLGALLGGTFFEE
jgi:K+/H+ antiporter YhaU regulatory subunit KhtT